MDWKTSVFTQPRPTAFGAGAISLLAQSFSSRSPSAQSHQSIVSLVTRATLGARKSAFSSSQDSNYTSQRPIALPVDRLWRRHFRREASVSHSSHRGARILGSMPSRQRENGDFHVHDDRLVWPIRLIICGPSIFATRYPIAARLFVAQQV
jgi:hypothetical protein